MKNCKVLRARSLWAGPILYGPFLCAEPASNKENQVVMSHEILYKNVLLRV